MRVCRNAIIFPIMYSIYVYDSRSSNCALCIRKLTIQWHLGRSEESQSLLTSIGISVILYFIIRTYYFMPTIERIVRLSIFCYSFSMLVPVILHISHRDAQHIHIHQPQDYNIAHLIMCAHSVCFFFLVAFVVVGGGGGVGDGGNVSAVDRIHLPRISYHRYLIHTCYNDRLC